MKLLVMALLVATTACSSRSRAPEYDIDVETMRMYRERTPEAATPNP